MSLSRKWNEGVLKVDTGWGYCAGLLAQGEAAMLLMRSNEDKPRGFQTSGIANAAKAAIATDRLGPIWKQKTCGKS